MTMGGKCLYDKAELTRVIKSANETIVSGKSVLERIERQMACGVKGHEMVYNRSGVVAHIFKCKSCGIEIAKTKSELTVKEKEALKLLKIL